MAACRHGTPIRDDGIPLCGACRTPEQDALLFKRQPDGFEMIDASAFDSPDEVAEWFQTGKRPRRAQH